MADAADPNLAPSERRADVVDLYREGLTFTAIGKKLGFSRQRAHELYWQAMRAVVEHAVTAHRAAMVEELTETIRVSATVMHADHYAHSNGRVVVDPVTGDPVVDDGPKLDAARTIVAAHARLAKLLGADAATKVESDVSLTYQVVGVDPADLT